jgi:predicted transcriptional regulator
MTDDAIRQDSLKAWETYCATGLHVSAEKADDWLVQLEQGRDVDPPHANAGLDDACAA